MHLGDKARLLGSSREKKNIVFLGDDSGPHDNQSCRSLSIPISFPEAAILLYKSNGCSGNEIVSHPR